MQFHGFGTAVASMSGSAADYRTYTGQGPDWGKPVSIRMKGGFFIPAVSAIKFSL